MSADGTITSALCLQTFPGLAGSDYYTFTCSNWSQSQTRTLWRWCVWSTALLPEITNFLTTNPSSESTQKKLLLSLTMMLSSTTGRAGVVRSGKCNYMWLSYAKILPREMHGHHRSLTLPCKCPVADHFSDGSIA